MTAPDQQERSEERLKRRVEWCQSMVCALRRQGVETSVDQIAMAASEVGFPSNVFHEQPKPLEWEL